MRTTSKIAAVVVAVAASAVLVGCGSGPTDEQERVVCLAMQEASKYGGYIDPVKIARDTLVEDYAVAPSDAMDVIKTAVDDQCPQYRKLI